MRDFRLTDYERLQLPYMVIACWSGVKIVENQASFLCVRRRLWYDSASDISKSEGIFRCFM